MFGWLRKLGRNGGKEPKCPKWTLTPISFPISPISTARLFAAIIFYILFSYSSDSFAQVEFNQAETFPPLEVMEDGRVLLARHIEFWRWCGDEAIIVHKKTSPDYYWRNITTGEVIKLPFKWGEVEIITCTPDGINVFLELFTEKYEKVTANMNKRDAERYYTSIYNIRTGTYDGISNVTFSEIAWSPDNKRVAFVWSGYDEDSVGPGAAYSSSKIWLRLPKNFKYQPVFIRDPGKPDNVWSGGFLEMFWLPDSTHIYTQRRQPQKSLSGINDIDAIWKISSDRKGISFVKSTRDMNNAKGLHGAFPIGKDMLLTNGDVGGKSAYYMCAYSDSELSINCRLATKDTIDERVITVSDDRKSIKVGNNYYNIHDNCENQERVLSNPMGETYCFNELNRRGKRAIIPYKNFCISAHDRDLYLYSYGR